MKTDTSGLYQITEAAHACGLEILLNNYGGNRMMLNKKLLRPLCLMLALSAMLLAAGCSPAEQGSAAVSITAGVYKDAKFDCADLTATAEDFANAGFEFGDSCDVAFSNGYTISDVPYYTGYYVKTGDPVIVAYPKNDYVLVANNNRGLWTTAELNDECTVTITLNTAGKYLATSEALSQSYSPERSDYQSDEQFANFRALSGGSMRENFIYRGASPVDNSRGRAAITDSLVERAGIRCIIDLADSDEDMQGYFAADDFASDYTKTLYEQGRDIVLSMGANFDSEEYKQSVAAGMRQLLKYGGPAYIHCMEGKDRTGFVCLVLEALCGAGYDELCADYMATYANYYGITKEKTPDRYQAVVSLYFDSFIEYLVGSDAATWQTADYPAAAREYLTACGMTEQEIEQLRELLTGTDIK